MVRFFQLAKFCINGKKRLNLLTDWNVEFFWAMALRPFIFFQEDISSIFFE